MIAQQADRVGHGVDAAGEGIGRAAARPDVPEERRGEKDQHATHQPSQKQVRAEYLLDIAEAGAEEDEPDAERERHDEVEQHADDLAAV